VGFTPPGNDVCFCIRLEFRRFLHRTPCPNCQHCSVYTWLHNAVGK
jgi:hypothetical protein